MLVAQGEATGDIIRIFAQQHAEVAFLDLDLTLQRGDQGLGTGQLHLGLVVSRLGSKSALIAKLRQADTLTTCVQGLLYDLGKDKFNTPEEKAFIQENFPYCLNISIDYGIMEKAHNVYMLCVDFGWADLGSWGSLFDLANKDENENAVLKNNEAMLYECSGNVIALNNPKRLAVIQGLKDCIVAESGNVLLICKKDDEQRIKQFVADAKIKYGKEYN